MPLWSLLPSWAAAFQTPGGLWVILPTGQGSFLLSPFLHHLLISHASWVSRVFWVSRAVICLQPGSHPVAVPRESVLPGVSPQGVIIVCHCTTLRPRGPSEASGGSVTACLCQYPGVLASLQRVGMLRGHAGCGCPSLSSWSCVSHLLRALSVLGAVCVLLRVG